MVRGELTGTSVARAIHSSMSTGAAHPIPNLALLAAELSSSTAKRLVASVKDVESVEDLRPTLAASAEARVAGVQKGLELADAEVA